MVAYSLYTVIPFPFVTIPLVPIEGSLSLGADKEYGLLRGPNTEAYGILYLPLPYHSSLLKA